MYKVILQGPVLTSSGYGVHTRTVLRALRSRPDLFDVHVIPMGWGHTGWQVLGDEEEHAFIDNAIRKTIEHKQANGAPYDIFLQVSIPNEFVRQAKTNIGVTAVVETNKVSATWLQKGNEMDRIITISNHAEQVYRNTYYDIQDQNGNVGQLRLQRPIDIVGYPVKHYEDVALDLKLDFDFNFLMIAQWSPRKNVENTIKWFVEEYKDQEVGLVIKGNIAANSKIDKEFSIKRLNNFIKTLPTDRKCKIYLLHGEMSDAEVHALYRLPQIKALVSLAHGESFGLPLFEAAYSGLPVIAPAWGGPLDFLYAPVTKDGKTKMRPHFLRVDFSINKVQKEAVWKGVIDEDAMWCYPEEKSFKEQLRELEKNHQLHKSRAKTLQKHLVEKYTEENINKAYVESILKAVQGEAPAAPTFEVL